MIQFEAARGAAEGYFKKPLDRVEYFTNLPKILRVAKCYFYLLPEVKQ